MDLLKNKKYRLGLLKNKKYRLGLLKNKKYISISNKLNHKKKIKPTIRTSNRNKNTNKTKKKLYTSLKIYNKRKENEKLLRDKLKLKYNKFFQNNKFIKPKGNWINIKNIERIKKKTLKKQKKQQQRRLFNRLVKTPRSWLIKTYLHQWMLLKYRNLKLYKKIAAYKIKKYKIKKFRLYKSLLLLQKMKRNSFYNFRKRKNVFLIHNLMRLNKKIKYLKPIVSSKNKKLMRVRMLLRSYVLLMRDLVFMKKYKDFLSVPFGGIKFKKKSMMVVIGKLT